MASPKSKSKTKTRSPRSDEQLLIALASPDYGTYSGAADELEEWLEAGPAEALARATRIGELALTAKHAGARRALGCVILPTLAAATKRGEPIAAKWDALVTAFGPAERHRAFLATLPVGRRTAIFDREIVGDKPNAIARIAEYYLDLAPESARTILEHYAARRELRTKIKWEYLTQWKRKAPRIGAILKEYEARAKSEAVPAPPPKVPGTLSFADPIAVYPTDYPTLDTVAKAQYRQAARAYTGGGEIKDAKDFVRRLKKMDLDESDAGMRRWHVTKGGKHLYDFWGVWVDNGSLFQANSAKRIPVHQIQDDFQALDRKEASKALAEDLNNSYPGDLWTMPKRATAKKKSKKKN